LQYYKYKQTTPFLLLITIDYETNELVIEFSSKILGVKCVELINEDTIYECLCNVEPLIEFSDDVEFILDDFKVVRCDVTVDVDCSDTEKLENYVKANLTNYDKWKCEHYSNGFTLKNIVSTRHNKLRITVYDKAKEMKLKRNKPFLDAVEKAGDGDDVWSIEDYFKFKKRLELNINSAKQIKELLEIADNKLLSVLQSKANPMLTVFNRALKETPVNAPVIHTLKAYLYELVLKDCDYNLDKVEAKVRGLISKNTSVTKAMKPYREYYHSLRGNNIPMFDIRQLVV